MQRDDPARVAALPPQPISTDVLAEKYLKDGERTLDDLYERVARALASVEAPPLRELWEARFLENLRRGAIGAGRIMSAAGTDLEATLINCFVQPVGDAIQGRDEQGLPGIYEALREAAETMRRGGGVGYDFSAIRPRGAIVHKTRSIASGPCGYIDVFDRSCATVESAGARRGAQMGVLRIDHPDVREFIAAKRQPGRWSNFNVSVGVPGEFMRALEAGADWPLVHRAEPGPDLVAAGAHQRADGLWVYRTVPARELWDLVMRSAYDFAEPGILFLDAINTDNNLAYCERITATNPCVTADTWVMTTDGPAQVADLVGRRFTAVVDGKAYPVDSEGFFATGRKKVLRLRTCEGHELRLTPDHLVRKVARRSRYVAEVQWSPAGDLRRGDEIVLHDHRATRGWQGQGSEQEGYLLGLLIGAGALKEDEAVLSVWAPVLKVVGGTAPALSSTGAAGIVAAVEAAFAEMPHRANVDGSRTPWVPAFAGTTGTFHSRGGGNPGLPVFRASPSGEMRLVSGPLLDLAFSFGLRPGHLTLTPAIERGSAAFTSGVLRGLFDANGSVHDGAGPEVCIHLTQTDVPMLHAAQRMLLRLGVVSTLDQSRHELVISGANLLEFEERVGFADTGKRERLDHALSAHRRALDTERFTATVESVDEDGEEDVYDVTVRDVHAFDANGLDVHNCGEQPLPAYGCCDLGPVILTRFVRHPFGFGGDAAFDFDAFRDAVAVQVRALDNVLDLTHWPLPQQQAEASAKRRIGVGFTGLGNALAMLKLRYDEDDGRAMAVRIARAMRDAAYAASVELAKEKGAFPAFDAGGYLRPGTFASRLDPALQDAIRAHGIRNSHLLSVAPTGTVSLAFADNASNGIEPPFSWTYRRKKREADGSTREYEVVDHAWRVYRSLAGEAAERPPYFVGALEMPASSHLAMMEAVQPFVDTSISKTVNVPEDYPYDDFQDLYLEAWRAGLKGLATYRPNTILGSVLDAGPAPVDAAPQPGTPMPDPMRAVIERRPRGTLPAVAEKVEYWTQQGRQTLYLVVSFLPVGDGRERAIEFFMPVGQQGESQQWISACMRLLSLAARGGFLDRALADMRKVAWDRGPVRLGTYQRADGAEVPLWHDSEVAAIAYAIQALIARRRGDDAPALTTPAPAVGVAGTAMAGTKCPECGAHAVIRKDGCEFCTQCGHVGACG